MRVNALGASAEESVETSTVAESGFGTEKERPSRPRIDWFLALSVMR